MNALTRYIALASLSLSTSACFSLVEGNGDIREESRDVTAFSAVEVSGTVELELVVDPAVDNTVTLALSGDANLLALLETRVEGERLIIEMPDGVVSFPTTPIKVSAIVPELHEIDASGSTDVRVAGLDTEQLEVDTSGSSRVDLAGIADTVRFDTSGSSQVHAFDLITHEVYIDASGAAYYEVCADERLEVDASGSATVRYSCVPEAVVTTLSGMATVLPVAY